MRHAHVALAVLSLLPAPMLQAQTAYYRHAIFDNSLQADYYWNSTAQATAPSTLEQDEWRLPVDTTRFLSPPNALRLQWQSQPGGAWDAEIHLVNFRNRFPELEGHTLYFWVYTPEPIASADPPDVVLSDARSGLQVATFPGSFTAPEPLGKYTGDLPAQRWVQVRIPMAGLRSASVYGFAPEHLQSVVFHQGRADGVPHTLIVAAAATCARAARRPTQGTRVGRALNAPSGKDGFRWVEEQFLHEVRITAGPTIPTFCSCSTPGRRTL